MEDASPVLEIVVKLVGIDELALARNCEVSALVAEEQGLDVVETALGGICILCASYRNGTVVTGKFTLGQDFACKAEATVVKTASVGLEGGKPRSFLAPVLKGVKTELNRLCRVLHAINSKYAHILSAISLYEDAISPRSWRKRSLSRGFPLCSSRRRAV